MEKKIVNKGKGRMFDNKALELLSRTHPAIILGMYIPLSTFLVWYYYTQYNESLLAAFGLFFGGAFFWTFAEYLLHRYAFHWINDTEISKKIHRAIHGMHHSFPRDKGRLLMPPAPSILLAATFFLIFRVTMGYAGIPFLAGFIIGYLIYGMMHYAIHTVRPPKFMRPMWRMHTLHHYKYPDKYFGVSSPLWDYVFGTIVPEEEQKAAAKG